MARGYGFALDAVYDMDFITYLIAFNELNETPSIDTSFLLFFGKNNDSVTDLTPTQARRKRLQS